MAPQSLNLRYIAIKEEATPGTYVEPADADFDIRIMIPETVGRTIEFDDDAAKYASGDHAEDVAIAGAQSGNVDFTIRLPWSGAVDTEPNWWKAAKACGCDVVTYTTTGLGLVRRKAKDETTYSVTVVDQTIGASPVYTARKYSGCAGNFQIGADGIGRPWIGSFSLSGVPQGDEDGAGYALDLTSPDTANAENFLSSTFTLQGESVQCSQFSFDLGNTVNPIIDQSKSTGHSHYVITSTNPRFSTNPLAKSQATWDVWANAIAETTGVISLTSDNFTFKGVKAQLMSPELATREGLINWNLNFRLLKNGTTGSLVDSTLTTEDTFELLQGARA